MNFSGKGLYAKVSLIFGGIYLFLFTLYFLLFYIEGFEFFVYIDLILNRLTYLLLPIVAGAVTFICESFLGGTYALTRLIPLSLMRLIYFIPYFYLSFMGSGARTPEALLLGTSVAIADALFAYALSFIVFILLKKLTGRSGADAKEVLVRKTALDFSDPFSLGIAIASLLPTLFFLAGEIADTVSFFFSYGASFTAGELIYTVFCYLFDFSLFFIHYYAVICTKNYVIRRRVK